MWLWWWWCRCGRRWLCGCAERVSSQHEHMYSIAGGWVCECGKPACKEAVATADSLRPHGLGVSYRDWEERICSGEAHASAGRNQ